MPQFSIETAGLSPEIINAFDDLIVQLQTWTGTFDGQGKWVDVPYDPGIYSAVTGTWTVASGSHRRFKYSIIGQEVMVLQVAVSLSATSAGIGNDLRIRIPPGYVHKPNASGIQDGYSFVGACEYNAGAVSSVGYVYAGEQNKAPTQLRLLRDILSPSTNWPAGVTDLSIAFVVLIPVQRA